MALLLQHEKAGLIRANLSAFFVVSCVLSLVVQVPAGYMTWRHLELTLPLIPATLLGFWIATNWANKVSSRHIRAASLVLCTLSGASAIALYWRA